MFDREALVRNLAIGTAMLLVAFFVGWNLFNLLFVYWLEITLVAIATTIFSIVVYIRAVLEKTTEEEKNTPAPSAFGYLLIFILVGCLGYFMLSTIISAGSIYTYHMMLSITNQPPLPRDIDTNRLENSPFVVFGYAAKNLDLPSVVFAVLLLADFFARKSMRKIPKWESESPEKMEAKTSRVNGLLAKIWLPAVERCIAFLAIIWLGTQIPSVPGIAIMFALVAIKSLADSIGDDEPALSGIARWLVRPIVDFGKRKI